MCSSLNILIFYLNFLTFLAHHVPSSENTNAQLILEITFANEYIYTKWLILPKSTQTCNRTIDDIKVPAKYDIRERLMT